MNEKLLHLLSGQEELYPLNLEEKYQRILTRIVDLWDSKEIDDYFNDLTIDNPTYLGIPKNKIVPVLFNFPDFSQIYTNLSIVQSRDLLTH